MIKDDANQRLSEVLNRLHAFAARFSGEEYVDEESALTAHDLNLALTMLEQVHANPKGVTER
jgi:hypothetical protein